MSQELRRLALGVIMPGFEGRRTPDWLAAAIGDGLRSVCYFGHNISPDPIGTRALSDDLHDRGIALIAADEEGGTVSRLGTHDGSPHLGAAALGAVGDTMATAAVAAAIGHDLRSVGVDLDFAPVADVDNNADNPVIGIRSFGSDPWRVALHVASAVLGLQSQGVAACAKHFPGHGDTSVDSHLGLPRIDHAPERLDRVELMPFRGAIAAGARAIMTAHIVYGSLDPAGPATTSPVVLQLLREELGFDGLIITDALDMRAIRDGTGVGEGCVRALQAGVDVLALGNAVLNDDGRNPAELLDESVHAIETALADGRLDPARLDEAAGRVADTRRWLDEAPRADIAPATKDQEIAWAAEALTVRGPVCRAPGPLRIVDARRARNLAAGAMSDVLIDELVHRRPGSQVHRTAVPDADVVLTGAIGVDPAQDRDTAEALELSSSAVLLCATGERRLPWAQERPAVVQTAGHSRPTAVAVADLLAPN